MECFDLLNNILVGILHSKRGALANEEGNQCPLERPDWIFFLIGILHVLNFTIQLEVSS